jgi:transcriptional regulator with XRE-family HTH domain
METMERDPVYIAQQVKFLRKMFRLTQENLANAAGLTTRTIEKIESGRHRPEEQTLLSLARGLGLDVAYFQKPTPEQEARQRAEIERAVRKTVLVPTDPIRTASEFLAAFDQRHAFRFDTSAAESDEALEIAASLVDWIKDLNDVWGDCSMSQRLEYARSFVEKCAQLERLGLLCHMGQHRQVLRERGRPDMVFIVGLMSIQARAEVDGRRYGLVQLEGGWEAVESDRMPLPEGAMSLTNAISQAGFNVAIEPSSPAMPVDDPEIAEVIDLVTSEIEATTSLVSVAKGKIVRQNRHF